MCVGDVPLRGLLFFCASKAAAAGPLTRVMQVMVVILGRVDLLTVCSHLGLRDWKG